MDSIAANSAGQRAGVGAIDCPAKLASGISFAMATAGNDYTQTVAEKSYVLTPRGGFCLFSLTGVTSTAANVEYVAEDGQTIIIHVPYGYTTLYGESDVNTTTVFMRELVVQSPE